METPDATRPPSKASGAVTAAVVAAVAIVTLIFLSKTVYYSSWYALFKVVHVFGAVVWVGGGVLLTILALRAERSSDPREMAAIARQAAFVGQRVFAPVGLLVFAMGVAMVIDGQIDWGTTWITIAFIGYVVTFLTGIRVLGPQAKRIGELMETEGPDAAETQAAVQRLMLIARVDVGVLLIVVADMVLKPFS